MKTEGQRLDGLVITSADPWYAGKLDDPQGGDITVTMRMEQEGEIRSHDGQSGDRRQIKMDLADVGEDEVSATVRICK